MFMSAPSRSSLGLTRDRAIADKSHVSANGAPSIGRRYRSSALAASESGNGSARSCVVAAMSSYQISADHAYHCPDAAQLQDAIDEYNLNTTGVREYWP